MTTEAVLSREHVQRIEPEQVDATGRTWLSGYAIPTGVEAVTFAGRIARFEFRYPTTELKHDEPVLIDDLKPAVAVAYTPGIRRVLAVHFAPTVWPADLPSIVARLEQHAQREAVVSKKLSLLLVAALLREAAAGQLWDWEAVQRGSVRG